MSVSTVGIINTHAGRKNKTGELHILGLKIEELYPIYCHLLYRPLLLVQRIHFYASVSASSAFIHRDTTTHTVGEV